MLWNSNGVFTNSGYAVFQRDLLYRLLEDGWPVAQVAFWGLEGYPIPLDGEFFEKRFKGLKLRLYPKIGEPFGSDAMYLHSKDYGANVVFSMQDVQNLNPEFLIKLHQEKIPWIPYCPIDKDPTPPLVLDKLKYAYKIVSFSKFGQKTLQDSGFASTLILEGTDPGVFKPMDRSLCRKELNLPEKGFMFLMVAANKENPPRKGFQEALQAFKTFQDKHTDAFLMIHSQQPSPAGFPIKQFAHHIGINMNQLFFMEEYRAVFSSDSHTIAKEINASNVLLHPSHTEGFGLTVIESMSCGIPVIVNNTTSMPELVVDGITGEICKAGIKRYTNDLSWTTAADVDSLYEKMENLYSRLEKDEAGIAKACRQHIIDNYDMDKLYQEKWLPFLEKLQERIMGSLTPTAG